MKKARIFQEELAKSAAGIEKPKKFGIGSGSGLQASPGNVSKVADIVLYWVKGGSSEPERLCDAFADALLYVLDDTRWAQLGKEVACMQPQSAFGRFYLLRGRCDLRQLVVPFAVCTCGFLWTQ